MPRDHLSLRWSLPVCNRAPIHREGGDHGRSPPTRLTYQIWKSNQVDYQKRGVRVPFPKHLHPQQKPDFMDERYGYPSQKVLGRLHRAAASVDPSALDGLWPSGVLGQQHLDSRLLHAGFERQMERAQSLYAAHSRHSSRPSPRAHSLAECLRWRSLAWYDCNSHDLTTVSVRSRLTW